MTESPASILYIDDDDGLCRLTRRALERRGHRVATAASGAEGVALAANEAFDLVAVDHYMPGMDGLQTLAELQRIGTPPPVIYVTASDESQLAVAAIKAGAIDYVVKSAHADYFDLLGEAIDQALATVKLRRAHALSEQQLRESNERLETLLKEVNHRVANSLQLVSSFIRLQARALDEPAAKEALEDADRRVAAIAQVHRRLYTSSSVETVDMAEYLASLIEELGETWSTPEAPRSIELQAQPLSLATDKAVAVGIIVNELVTNACKYAYTGAGGGQIRVTLDAGEKRGFRLTVEDDGCGLSAGSAQRGTGLGTKLIGAMASSLKADVRYEDGQPGLRAVVTAK